MSRQENQKVACDPSTMDSECCKVEALVTVDRKGQILLPKDLREKENIKEGDRFAIVNVGAGGTPCCLILMKADILEPMVQNALGPVLKIVVQREDNQKNKKERL
ncbi:MAG: HgcAB-associated protein HgcC [Candidatus Hodarchaeota archaeon]